MVMTDSIKNAFRIAYNTLEKLNIPEGDEEEKARKFGEIANIFGYVATENQENPLVEPLLIGLYEYLDRMSKTGGYVK